MRVMALDDATKFGHALYDTDKPMSAIISHRFHLDGDTPFEKIQHLRMILPKLLRELKPDFVAIELAKTQVTKFHKKAKVDLLTGAIVEPAQGSEFAGDDRTTSMLNAIFGATVMAVLGQNIPCCAVHPKTWQTIIPKSIRGDPKQRVAQFLNSLNIVSPNMDSRDAVAIAIWAAGNAQEVKMLERARISA